MALKLSGVRSVSVCTSLCLLPGPSSPAAALLSGGSKLKQPIEELFIAILNFGVQVLKTVEGQEFLALFQCTVVLKLHG